MKPRIDLSATLLDFKSMYTDDPDAAIRELLVLLLDPVACETRQIVLEEIESLGAERAGLGGMQMRPIPADRWTAVIDAVGRLGPRPALATGQVTADELDALTWNRDALATVHRRLTEPSAAPSGGPHPRDPETKVSKAETRVTLSRLPERGDTAFPRKARPANPPIPDFTPGVFGGGPIPLVAGVLDAGQPVGAQQNAADSPEIPHALRTWSLRVPAEQCVWHVGDPEKQRGSTARIDLAWYAAGQLAVSLHGLLRLGIGYSVAVRWLGADGTPRAEPAVLKDQIAVIRLESTDKQGPRPGDRLVVQHTWQSAHAGGWDLTVEVPLDRVS